MIIGVHLPYVLLILRYSGVWLVWVIYLARAIMYPQNVSSVTNTLTAFGSWRSIRETSTLISFQWIDIGFRAPKHAPERALALFKGFMEKCNSVTPQGIAHESSAGTAPRVWAVVLPIAPVSMLGFRGDLFGWVLAQSGWAQNGKILT